MLEREIEKKLVKYCKRVGCITYKFVSPSQRGVPDRIIISPCGKVGFLELKQYGKKPNAQQMCQLLALQQHNVLADWADTIEGCMQFVDLLMFDYIHGANT